MQKTDLTKTMQAACHYANQHGALVRYPGGFWQGDGGFNRGAEHYSTSTVAALVKRGVAKYTAWQKGKHRTFPIRVELTTEDEQLSLI